MMKKLVVGMLLFTVTASGCVATQATMLQPTAQYAMVSPAQVRVFLREDDIKVPYEKVAIIHAQGESTMTNEQEMITAAKAEAARAGANGIVLSKIDEPSAGAKVAGMVFGVGVMRRGEILGIRTKE
jgi:osmotically-inducible protein OsmY